MKTYFSWLKTEYKRAVYRLPAILMKAVILAAVAGVIAFCGQKLMENKEQTAVKIGYTAPDDRMTQLAVSFIENMESVKSWCELVPVSEEDGKKLLKEGKLEALLVLPKQVVEGILSGSNTPAGLYVAENTSPYGLVFEELAGAGVGMLTTAQAEIYATGLLTEQFSCGTDRLLTLYEKIDRFNLGISMAREQYFKHKTLSVTGNQSAAVYYGSVLLTLYLLTGGFFPLNYLGRKGMEQRMLVKRCGLSMTGMLCGRVIVTMGILFTELLPLAVFWLFKGVREQFEPAFSAGSIGRLVLSVCFLALWLQFIHLAISQKGTVILAGSFFEILFCYFAGCFVPTALLPQIVVKAAKFLPVTYIKEGFSVLLSGTGKFSGGNLVLAGWSFVLFLACLLLQKYRMEHHETDPAEKGKTGTDFHSGVAAILAKRLLRKKSFFVCLLLMVLISVFTMNMGQKSEAELYAAVCAKEEKWISVLTEYQGLVQFIPCESEEEVKRNVLQGNAECGYVLQEDLQNQIVTGKGNWSITVYESPDSMLTEMVNEVIFERIFYVISSEWYAGYIAEEDCFKEAVEKNGKEAVIKAAREALEEKMEDGSTFTFNTLTVESETGTEKEEKKNSFYPLWGVVYAGILGCGMIGTLDALGDKKAGRLRKKSGRYRTVTILLPVGCGLLTGMATILLCGVSIHWWQVAATILFSLLVTAAGVLVQWIAYK